MADSEEKNVELELENGTGKQQNDRLIIGGVELPPEKIGMALRIIRIGKDLSAEEVADRLGCSATTVYAHERGEAGLTWPDIMAALDACGATLAEYTAATALDSELDAEKLALRRTACGLSIRQCAADVNVAPSTWARWEKGERVPIAGKLQAIADVLHCSVHDIAVTDFSSVLEPPEEAPVYISRPNRRVPILSSSEDLRHPFGEWFQAEQDDDDVPHMAFIAKAPGNVPEIGLKKGRLIYIVPELTYTPAPDEWWLWYDSRRDRMYLRQEPGRRGVMRLGRYAGMCRPVSSMTQTGIGAAEEKTNEKTVTAENSAEQEETAGAADVTVTESAQGRLEAAAG